MGGIECGDYEHRAYQNRATNHYEKGEQADNSGSEHRFLSEAAARTALDECKSIDDSNGGHENEENQKE